MDTWHGSLVMFNLGTTVARACGTFISGAVPGPDSAPTDDGMPSWVSTRSGLLGIVQVVFEGGFGVDMLRVGSTIYYSDFVFFFAVFLFSFCVSLLLLVVYTRPDQVHGLFLYARIFACCALNMCVTRQVAYDIVK